MTLVLACPVHQYDAETGTCHAPVWISQPGLLPPLSVADGFLISGGMITVIGVAWGLKALRRFIWPRA